MVPLYNGAYAICGVVWRRSYKGQPALEEDQIIRLALKHCTTHITEITAVLLFLAPSPHIIPTPASQTNSDTHPTYRHPPT